MTNRMVVGSWTLAIVAVLLGVSLMAQRDKTPASRLVEIRSYHLEPGTRDRFHKLLLAEALPMLGRWKVEVVAYGPSLHDSDSYYLMRGFPGLDERQKSEDAFYGSEEWKKGPREAVLADIVNYTTVVIRVDDATLRGLRMPNTSAAASSDLATLMDLNHDYIQSVQTSNVQRFREILGDDFLCSNPDGSLIDRERFLAQTAKPVTISNLQAHDVNVRILGDIAIVHARTTFTGPDGRAASGRYTDVWAKRQGKWLAVSAHVTRLP